MPIGTVDSFRKLSINTAMLENILKNAETQKSYRLKDGCRFTIPVKKLTEKLSDAQKLILTLGIGQFGFSHPRGSFRFEGLTHKIEGFYTEIRICVGHTDKDISFSLASPSGYVRLCWWSEGAAKTGTDKRISVIPKIDTDYNAALHCYLSLRCNLHCDYCFIPENILHEDAIKPIQIGKFIKVLNETGKIFNIVFSGGEPFFIPNFVEACARLSENHFISIATNLSLSKKIEAFRKSVNPKRVKYILCSFHANELKKRKMIHTFIENYRLLKDSGFTIHAQIVAYPPIIPEIEFYQKLFAEYELELICAPFIGEYNNKTYPAAYSPEEYQLINCDMTAVRSSYNWKHKPCIAGYNNGVVNSNNDVVCCINIKQKIGNIYDKITFQNSLVNCPHDFCSVPLSMENYSLHLTALKETAKQSNVSG